MQQKSCPHIDGLSEIAEHYDAVLCDVWGVVHNGVEAFEGALDALSKFKASGKTTFLLTNAPRPYQQVYLQLEKLGVDIENTFDAIVTSGDVTRERVTQLAQPVFHLGTEFDKSVYAGLDVTLADIETAKSVVCTGLFDDFTETPDDYREMLAQFKTNDLPFLCANPDMVVEHGGIMRWCAGALAAEYEKIGGQTEIIGKPHAPAYQHALARMAQHNGATIDSSKVLAIGDGMKTDIKGAVDFGLDVIFIAAGIHSAEYGGRDAPDEAQLHAYLKQHEMTPVAWMPKLKW